MSRYVSQLNLRGVLTEALAFVIGHADKDEDPEQWTLTRELRAAIEAEARPGDFVSLDADGGITVDPAIVETPAYKRQIAAALDLQAATPEARAGDCDAPFALLGFFDPDVIEHFRGGLIDPVGVIRRKPNGTSTIPIYVRTDLTTKATP